MGEKFGPNFTKLSATSLLCSNSKLDFVLLNFLFKLSSICEKRGFSFKFNKFYPDNSNQFCIYTERGES